MPIFPCPSCGKQMSVPASADGKKVRCPGCGSVLTASQHGLQPPVAMAVQTAASARERTDEDEDNRRPARSRRDDDDYDDDDRPRSKRRSRDDDPPRRPRKKVTGGGIPAWVWWTGGSVLAGGLGLILLFTLLGGNKFSRVKVGMSEKEVRDMLGTPTEDGFTVTWYDPPMTQADMLHPEKAMKIKEMLVVQFENGKVKSAVIHSARDYRPRGFP